MLTLVSEGLSLFNRKIVSEDLKHICYLKTLLEKSFLAYVDPKDEAGIWTRVRLFLLVPEARVGGCEMTDKELIPKDRML